MYIEDDGWPSFEGGFFFVLLILQESYIREATVSFLLALHGMERAQETK